MEPVLAVPQGLFSSRRAAVWSHQEQVLRSLGWKLAVGTDEPHFGQPGQELLPAALPFPDRTEIAAGTL